MTNFHYYILKDLWSNDPQSLKTGTSIMKIQSGFTLNFDDGDGPYLSLIDLRKKSPIFKELSKTDPKRCQQILLKKNIHEIANTILTPKDTSFDLKYIDLIMHATKGRIKNGKITGVHFFDKNKVRIREILDVNQVTKVWRAKIEFFDKTNNNWLLKNTPSTFFPKHWNFANLLEECNEAYKNRKKVIDSENKYRATTISNVPVEIIIKDGKMKSIYPLL